MLQLFHPGELNLALVRGINGKYPAGILARLGHLVIESKRVFIFVDQSPKMLEWLAEGKSFD
jgi:hypothetical protein